MVSLSIIIPVYNRVHLIDRTLASIINQDIEIIVVDDGSTDGTAECLAKYGDCGASTKLSGINQRHRITVLHQENKGAGAARNLGITQATGDYILFLDSDDLWFDWSLNTIKKTISQYNYPAFIAGNAVKFTDELELKQIKSTALEVESFADYYASSKQSLWLLNGAVAIKSEVLRQVGGFTSKWINCEDSDLWLKLGIAEHFVFIKSPAILAYYQHANSAVTNSQKTYEGAWHIINQEKNCLYPGNKARKLERLEIILRHIRPVTLAYLRDRNIIKAWQMYRETFLWNLSTRRITYLVAFWLILIKIYLVSLLAKICLYLRFMHNYQKLSKSK